MGGTICVGQSHNISVAITNGTGSTSFQWQEWDGSSWINIGSNNSSISVSPTSNTDYQCIIYSAGEGCNDPTTNTATVNVDDPSITGITNGGYVWSGYNSSDWENTTNWPAALTTISLVDMQGRRLLYKNEDVQSEHQLIKFDVGDIAPGMYVLTISSYQAIENIKIEKQ